MRCTKGRKNEGQKDLAALNHWPQEDSSIPKWPGAPVFNEIVPKPKLAVFLHFPAAVSQQMCNMEGLLIHLAGSGVRVNLVKDRDRVMDVVPVTPKMG